MTREALLHDMAEMYLNGNLTTDEYLDMMEEVCRQSVQPTTEG